MFHYSQARSSVESKVKSCSKVESVGSCRFQIHLCILACAISSEDFSLPAGILRRKSRVPSPRGEGTRDARLRMSAGEAMKIFNLTKYREVLVKYSLLVTHTGMLI